MLEWEFFISNFKLNIVFLGMHHKNNKISFENNISIKNNKMILKNNKISFTNNISIMNNKMSFKNNKISFKNNE